MNPVTLRHQLPVLLAVVLSLLGYYEFIFHLDRSDFPKLIALYSGLFILFWFIYKNGKQLFLPMVIAGILFRAVQIWGQPQLSQDFFRFLWDGELILMGLDPYLETPDNLFEQLRETLPNAGPLFSGMGDLSASHFSNYPPLNQFFFAMAAYLGGSTIAGKILVLKIILILADLGILHFGRKLLKHLGLPAHLMLLYFLNPYVILELSGNLHFEGVMMFFFLGGVWMLFKEKWLGSAFLTGASIAVKLIPLMFLPLLYMFITRGKIFPEKRRLITAVGYVLGVLIFLVLSFTPFFSPDNLGHFTASVNLWFSTFEFNASLYYLAREIGYLVKGYNIIGSLAPWIPVITAITVLILAFRKEIKEPKGLISSMLWAISIYLFISTTVHPWYLVTPLLLSILVSKQYVLVWTSLVMVSYFTYSREPFTESVLLLLLQYGVMYTIFFQEMFFNKKIKAF